MPEAVETRVDSQTDFTGGANAEGHAALLKPNQVARMRNAFHKSGGGVEARGGFKYGGSGTGQGNSIFEFDQSTGTVLTYQSTGPNWYDETMQPWYEVFAQTPQVNDAVYFGAAEQFFQLSLYTLDMPITPLVGNTFVWEYWNGAAWTDFTADVTGQVVNSVQMRGAPGEWVFSWISLATWSPNQVETRGYQYWIRIRCTVGGTNMGTNITQSQRRVRSDWIGRHLLVTGHKNFLYDWPGITLTPILVDSWTYNVERCMAASINDYLYVSSDGQRPLRRWNGCRGTTRGGVSNTPANAGLTAPTAAPTLTQQDNAAGYPVAWVGGYMLAFEYGPESILGESPPSPSATITVTNPPAASGAGQVTVDFTAARTQAGTRDVNAILIYATNDLVAVPTSQRSDTSRYNLLKRVVRGDTTWNTGTWVDAYTRRPDAGQTPIYYTNTPPFNPKGVCFGGDRLWIWNDRFVAWSDIARGDSWNPTNIKAFPQVRRCVYHEGMLLVFESRDISYIRDVNTGLPDIGYFWRGIGLAQPYTLSVGEGQIHFLSHDGPAKVVGRQAALTARGRVEDSYWPSGAPPRNLAGGAYHKGRFWFGVDSTGAGPGLLGNAVLDLTSDPDGAWSDHIYAVFLAWATLASIRCPLDHTLARQNILVGFAHGTATATYNKLAILEYGTSDNWTTNNYDGTAIVSVISTRALIMGGADRIKEFKEAHVKHHCYKVPSVGVAQATFQFQSLNGESHSKTITATGTATDVDQDFCFLPCENSAEGGRYRAFAPQLVITATTDSGWTLAGWTVRASADEFRVQ